MWIIAHISLIACCLKNKQKKGSGRVSVESLKNTQKAFRMSTAAMEITQQTDSGTVNHVVWFQPISHTITLLFYFCCVKPIPPHAKFIQKLGYSEDHSSQMLLVNYDEKFLLKRLLDCKLYIQKFPEISFHGFEEPKLDNSAMSISYPRFSCS